MAFRPIAWLRQSEKCFVQFPIASFAYFLLTIGGGQWPANRRHMRNVSNDYVFVVISTVELSPNVPMDQSVDPCDLRLYQPGSIDSCYPEAPDNHPLGPASEIGALRVQSWYHIFKREIIGSHLKNSEHSSMLSNSNERERTNSIVVNQPKPSNLTKTTKNCRKHIHSRVK
jgi:hypothetical protein